MVEQFQLQHRPRRSARRNLPSRERPSIASPMTPRRSARQCGPRGREPEVEATVFMARSYTNWSHKSTETTIISVTYDAHSYHFLTYYLRSSSAENLHRADLTVQERSAHVAEWIRLTEAKEVQGAPPSGDKPAQLGRVSKGGRSKEGGISAATRELGITRQEGQRALKIDSIVPEAKEAAREAGIDDNQSALLTVASKLAGRAREQTLPKFRECLSLQQRSF